MVYPEVGVAASRGSRTAGEGRGEGCLALRLRLLLLGGSGQQPGRQIVQQPVANKGHLRSASAPVRDRHAWAARRKWAPLSGAGGASGSSNSMARIADVSNTISGEHQGRRHSR